MTYKSAYVVDTHVLIWYLQNSKLLSANAQAIFRASERGETRIHVSAISVAEMYYANQKYRWFSNFSTILNELKQMPYIRIVEFAADDVLDFEKNALVLEMHDRIIVGLARRLDASLITVDSQIIAANLTPIVW